jgi:hypothetical protein
MQSIRLFIAERNLKRAARLSLENYSAYGPIETIPLYAAGTLVSG